MRFNLKILSYVLFISTIGCAAVSEYYVSVPIDKQSDDYNFWPNGIVHFDLPQIDLFIQPDNVLNTSYGIVGSFPIPPVTITKKDVEETDDSKKNEPFYVEVMIKAHKEGFAFNPMENLCILNDQKVIRVSKYLNPKKSFKSPSRNGMNALLIPKPTEYSWKYKIIEKNVNTYYEIPLDTFVGYRIRFDMLVPEPGDRFSIEIKGLIHEDKVVPLPVIQYFDKKKFRDIHT